MPTKSTVLSSKVSLYECIDDHEQFCIQPDCFDGPGRSSFHGRSKVRRGGVSGAYSFWPAKTDLNLTWSENQPANATFSPISSTTTFCWLISPDPWKPHDLWTPPTLFSIQPLDFTSNNMALVLDLDTTTATTGYESDAVGSFRQLVSHVDMRCNSIGPCVLIRKLETQTWCSTILATARRQLLRPLCVRLC